MKAGEVVDLRDPGVERFMTMRRDQQRGERCTVSSR